MGGKNNAPPAPDYEAMLEITEKNIASNEKLFDEFMAFSREAYEGQQALAEDYYELTRPATEAQVDLSLSQTQRYNDLAIPFEDSYIDQLTNWDSQARRDERAAEATADVETSFRAARDSELKRLESFGIDPSQTRSAALDTRVNTEGAIQKAGAATRARRQSEGEGIALKGEALNIYKGLPSTSAGALAAGVGSGTSGVNATGQAAQLGQQGYGIGSGMLGQRQDMLTSGYGTANSIYGNQLKAWEIENQNSPMGIVGGIAGAWAGGGFGLPFSDGGEVEPWMSPTGGARVDDVPARLNVGEVVVPEETVRYHGLKTLNKLNKEAQEALGLPEEV